MTAHSPLRIPRPRLPTSIASRLLVLATGLSFGVVAASPVAGAEPDSSARPVPVAADIAGMGYDNVTVDSSGTRIAYENRRFRHSAYGRGILDRRLAEFPPPAGNGTRAYYERRLGITAAMVETQGAPGDTGTRASDHPVAVRYPSDPGFSAPPPGRPRGDTRFATDFELGLRFAYLLGQLDDPFVTRLELEPKVRVNPWAGGRFTASFLIPIQNEFEPDPENPDIGLTRPGQVTLEQYAWVSKVALVTGTAGIFFDNRYGVSFGAARPFVNGALLLDTQADLTGYLAFPAAGTEYSGVELFTGFAGLTWRLPMTDASLRVRGGKFVYGDEGGEIELRRNLADLEVAFFYMRSAGLNASGIRVALPIPPSVRRHATTHPPGVPVRFLPVDRIPVEYREESEPTGVVVRGVASREDFLRQLNKPGLAANAYRYDQARGWPTSRPDPGAARISFTGTTGFINTPWCGVMPDRRVEIGYNQIPKAAAYDNRGVHRNDIYYATVGFLPRIEAMVRWTFIMGLKSFGDVNPDSKVTDSDRMVSGRLEILKAKPRRPGLAAGFDDASGTRRFHSTYVVSGMPVEMGRLRGRVSLGYAPKVFDEATRHILDGGFGAVEISPWRPLAASVEYDTEKWNAAVAYAGPYGLHARVALLDLQHVAFGGGWSFTL